jgi:hypothetical protein
MPPATSAELATLRSLIQTANLAADVKHAALWGLDQLSQLYADFVRTDESRFADAILRLARGLLKRLAEKEAGEDAGRVGDALVTQLGELHQRHGFVPLPLKLTASPAGGRKKKSA